MDINSLLKIVDGIHKQENFSFTKNTTYGCGGSASVAYFPANIKQTVALYKYLKEENKNFIILGNGSNILAADGVYDGAVISTKRLSGAELTSQNTLFCLAGTTVSQLLNYCVQNGVGGLEFLAGIPATLGGLAYMNGGAGGKFIGDYILNVKLFDGKIRNLPNKSCSFGYKYSTMRDINGVILGLELKITRKNGEEVKDSVAHYLEKRSCQPKGKSCGCVFKNPEGDSAGRIIEAAGLKGLTFGGAKVSEQHANFIINSGDKSRDVYKLIGEVKQKVFEKTEIMLEEEVVYIGDF